MTRALLQCNWVSLGLFCNVIGFLLAREQCAAEPVRRDGGWGGNDGARPGGGGGSPCGPGGTGVGLICMPYMYALYVCSPCGPGGTGVGLICMPYICWPYVYAVYAGVESRVDVGLICTPYMLVLYVRLTCWR